MPFPTSGYNVYEVIVAVEWTTPGGAVPYTQTLRFDRHWGGVGVTEACYEQAIADAVAAFAAALGAEATIVGTTYSYVGRCD